MTYRPFSVAAAISFSLLAVMLGLAMASIWIDPWSNRLTVTEDFHLGVWGRGVDIRLVFFNDADYGPYRSSIIGFVDDRGNVFPPLEVETRFGDTAGIYHRYFRRSGSTLWTIMVSVWYPVALFAVLPASWWFLRIRRNNND